MSGNASESSSAYLGISKFACYCGESADLWRSGTAENPGWLFLKCGMEKVRVCAMNLTNHFLFRFVLALFFGP
jgi:hypothetical protein